MQKVEVLLLLKKNYRFPDGTENKEQKTKVLIVNGLFNIKVIS